MQRGLNVVDAAQAAGIQHLVYASVGSADRKTGIPHWEIKWQVEQYIRKVGLPFTILRPTMFMENYADPTPRHRERRESIRIFQWLGRVFVPDVGPVAARLMSTPNAYGRVWHLAGAGVTTQQAIVEEIERQTGHRLRVRVAGKTMLLLLGLFNPFMREMVEMHYLLTDPVLMDDTALQDLLGPIHKTPYSDGVRECLAAVRVGAGPTS